MLSKKHFEAIAKLLNYTTHPNFRVWGVDDLCEDLIERFADYLQSQNPQFNRYKFVKACGKYKNVR